MAKKPAKKQTTTAQQSLFQLTFGDEFMRQHAGQIISDQNYAVIELVANCWDAGATRVDIKWPDSDGEFAISDNGIGMTKNELFYRWGKLNYNRLEEQGGKDVVFPKYTRHSTRHVFGRNGVGRHAMFCFADSYTIKTKKEGEFTSVDVTRSISGTAPFVVAEKEVKQIDEKEHGTNISCIVDSNRLTLIDSSKVIELIGSRFMADPAFQVYVNGHLVALTDIPHLTETNTLTVDGQEIRIQRIIAEKGRNTKQSGVAYWVKKRLVGNPNWISKFDQNLLIDGRHPIAKKVLYIVHADVLDEKKLVKPDWSGFYMTDYASKVFQSVSDFIKDDLRNLLYETRRERKLQAINDNRTALATLPAISKDVISHFIDEVQEKCPTISPQELEASVEVLAKLEKAKSGYSLLEKLAQYTSNDLDNLNAILEEWTIDDAKKVLSELKWRLELIIKLEQLVEDVTADELHDLQPLFDRGLWIFGPEFESISFISNRSLATIIKEYFGDAVIDNPARRPDFIALPEVSIGIYSSDRFDAQHNVSGFEKVVVVELKKAGVPITGKEKDQAMGYCRAIRESNKIDLSTKMVAYVLGSEILPQYDSPLIEGNTTVIPLRYNVVLRGAHARTFKLIEKIENLKGVSISSELDDMIADSNPELFTESYSLFNDLPAEQSEVDDEKKDV